MGCSSVWFDALCARSACLSLKQVCGFFWLSPSMLSATAANLWFTIKICNCGAQHGCKISICDCGVCRIGATSFVNVGAFIFPICANRYAAEQTANSKVRTVRFMRLCLCGCFRSNPWSRPRDHIKNVQHLLWNARRHRGNLEPSR